jgi:hypothetical protein
VIRELEVVFLRHAVAIEVGVVRHLPILFQKLRRIATCPAVDPVGLLAALLAVVTAAAPTVVTTIVVIQGMTFLKTPGFKTLARSGPDQPDCRTSHDPDRPPGRRDFPHLPCRLR